MLKQWLVIGVNELKCAITVTQNLFFHGKTDFIGRPCLLILRILLKAKNGPKIPAYTPVRHLF